MGKPASPAVAPKDELSAARERIAQLEAELAAAAKAKSELQRFKQIISSTPDMISLVDRDTRYQIVNDAYLANFHLQRQDILGKSVRDLVGEEHFRQVSEPCLQRAFAGDVVKVESWMNVPSLGNRYLAVTYHPVYDARETPDYVAIDCHDITAQKMAEDDRQRIFDYSPDMLCVSDFSGRLIELNPAWQRALGWSEDHLKSHPWLEFVHPDDRDATRQASDRLLQGESLTGFENRYRCQDGSYKWISWSSYPDQQRQRILSVARDVTNRKRLEEELRQLATSDPLTGASNRRHFIEQANAELKRCRRYGTALAVVMLDVDHFKKVNDSYGHDAGDEVLKKLVDCCLQELRATDLFGRFGGEEFAAVLVETSREAAMQTCERLKRKLAALQIRTRRGTVQITASIGLSLLAADDYTIDSLLKRADDALYTAKHSGRNQIILN